MIEPGMTIKELLEAYLKRFPNDPITEKDVKFIVEKLQEWGMVNSYKSFENSN